MSSEAVSDGRAEEPVKIDRTYGPDRWRYRCPNGHTTWDRTNNHIWCGACRGAAEQGRDVDPEHYHVVDEKTGDRIHWGDVELVS